jgi:hypothetical protein
MKKLRAFARPSSEAVPQGKTGSEGSMFSDPSALRDKLMMSKVESLPKLIRRRNAAGLVLSPVRNAAMCPAAKPICAFNPRCAQPDREEDKANYSREMHVSAVGSPCAAGPPSSSVPSSNPVNLKAEPLKPVCRPYLV